ncbi:SusC/RagA family TonB-linked outer membrane protein [Fodinibius saliphilus]|uniref:SusC/RagA family TonB-linked outer membrane protein n=1 Tax=Fodinibius saliphilus TaxID=1920650 RepID=UPI001BB21399|nr:SusC/RagA family TonB-linked outer membrane protein [Fodinibius saliphilus]
MKDQYDSRIASCFAKSILVRGGMAVICFMFVLLVGAVPAIAQSSTVSGTVLSADDQSPLPGVNIIEVGTQQGTTSDADGEFTLNVSNLNTSLRFSFVGFGKKTIELNGRSQISVTLEPQTEALDDVVVTALGLKRESKSLGYSVSEVESKDLVTATETNTANLLQGTVAGVNVSPTSGGPGSSSRVTIRGSSSLNGNNQPLYVVDGIPIDNTNFGSAGKWGGFDGGDGISSINSENIENISVLKGAGAAALYGARARDGVIVITTKSGEGLERGPVLNVSSTFTWNDAMVGFADYQSKYGQGNQGQKPQNQTEARNTGLSSWGAPLDGSSVVQFDGQKRPYVSHGDRLNQFYETGVSSKNSLSLSGGDKNSTYYFSTTYFDSESIVPNSGLERLSLTLRGSQTVGKLKADVKANYIDETANNRPWLSDSPGNANFSVAILPPNIGLDALQNNYMTEDGTEQTFSSNDYVNNPYWVVNQYDTDDNKDRIIGHVDLSYDLTDWASLQARTGLDWYTLRRTSFTPWGTAYRMGGDMLENEFRVLENTTDLIVKIDRQITSDIAVKATAGGAISYRKNETVGVSGSDFKVPKFRTISNMSSVTPNYDFSEKQVNSVYGSFDFSYNDYLYLTLTARNDWSSTLPKDGNAFFYPSISTSFVFSEAFSSAMPSWLSFGKVRGSWAEVGSDTDAYQLNLTYAVLNFTHQSQSAATVGGDVVPLSTLKPTSTKELEFGFDLRFFDDRLSLDASWYDRQTTNQILSTTISNTSGFGERMINAGQLDNSGIELLLSGIPVNTTDVLWETSLNYAQNKSEVVELAGEQEVLLMEQSRTQTATITATVGEEYGTIRGYKYKRDADGNIIHENGLPVQSDEQAVLGKGTPDWTLGWSNTVSYKSWSLNTLVGVHWGGQIFSGTNSYAYGAGLHKNTLEGRAGCDQAGTPYSPCFVADGVDINGGQNNTAVLPSAYYGNIEQNIAEEFVYDANFVKLRQLQLSYQLPQSLIAKLPIRTATLSATGRNLFYIYNSVPNVDPEATINRNNSQGLELAGVPGARSFGFSIDIGF